MPEYDRERRSFLFALGVSALAKRCHMVEDTGRLRARDLCWGAMRANI